MVAVASALQEFVEPSLPRVIWWTGEASPSTDWSTAGAWAKALAPYAVRIVNDVTALQRAAADGRADVIITAWRKELPSLASKLPLPTLVLGAELPEALVDAIAAGAPLTHVALPGLLDDELRSLARASRAAGVRHACDGATVSWRGSRSAAPVADVSCDGIAFVVEDEDLQSLLPGSELGELIVRQGDTTAVSGVAARVRHLVPLEPTGRYRVGCALSVLPTPAPAPSLIRDRALCAALIKAGLRTGLIIAPIDSATAPELQLTAARLDIAAGTLVGNTDRDFGDRAIVRGRFEVAGRLYRFTTVVVERAPRLTLALPATLEESQQRAAARHRPAAHDPVHVELTSPLEVGATMHKTLVDLSTSGLSFNIDAEHELFPLGLRLGVTIRLGDDEIHGSGSVRTFVRAGGQLRCGVELVPLGESSHARLSDFLMRRRFPDVQDGGAVPFAELADFFRATGFLYPAKEAVLAPIMDQVQHTFETLYAQPSRLFKSVVARHDGALAGHVSSIRVYNRTWMSQHLAATSSRHVSHLLNLGAAEYFGQNPDLEYFKIFFQSEIRWPARVFGGFARTLRDTRQSDLRELRHVTLSAVTPLKDAAPGDLEVMEASDEDLALVERHFVAREPSLVLQSDDLLRSTLRLAQLNKQFARLGLYRRRRILLAMKRGVCLGFAMAEVSSPGLNLSEALSMFRIHVTSAGEMVGTDVRSALLHGVQSLYRQAGRAFAGGLIGGDEVASYARLGITPDDTWLVWTCHRALYPRFCDYVDRLFDVLRRRQKGSNDTSPR
jgi:hypothetical protein